MKIFIRFGHEILKNGANTAANGILSEYDIIREYAPKVASYLQLLGHDIKIFEGTPGVYSTSNEALSAGVNEANNWNADLFVSCHVNAFSDSSANGTEVLHYQYSTEGKKIAGAIANEIVLAVGTNLRRGDGTYPSEIYELKATSMEAIIIEPFFCTNHSDCEKYNADKIAKAIVKGITGQEAITTYYRVVAGSFKSRDNAEQRVNELKNDGIDSFIDSHEEYYRVIAGSYTVRENAEAQLQYVESKGYDAFIAIQNI